jgi:hypothetical protein
LKEHHDARQKLLTVGSKLCKSADGSYGKESMKAKQILRGALYQL